jgi:hypothetical protein
MSYKRISPTPVVEGGTGAQTLTQYGVLVGEGTSAVSSTAAGTSGQVLTANTGADPTFQSPAASSITLTGDTGGPLTGNSFTIISPLATCGTLAFAGSGTTLTLTCADAQDNIFLTGTNANGLPTGSNNFGIGWDALTTGSAVTGSYNSFIGLEALFSLTSGTGNIAIGQQPLLWITSGNRNVCLSGFQGGVNYTAGTETDNILLNCSATSVTGENNTLRIGDGTGSGTQQLAAAYISGISGVNVGSVASVVSISGDQLGSATITAGAGITVTPTANTITIASTSAATSAFSSYITSPGVSNVTGDGTVYTVIFDNVYFDLNSDFNTGTGTFTAPATGIYAFQTQLAITNAGAAHTEAQLTITVGVNTYETFLNPFAIQGVGTAATMTCTTVAHMTSGDTATVQIEVSGSTKTVGLFSNSGTNPDCWFSGYRIA